MCIRDSNSISYMITSIVNSFVACDKALEMLDYVPKVNAEGGEKKPTFEGQITLQGVDFNYPTKSNAKVLENLSLDIESGDVVALVGSSGSGKSTVVSIIQRLYDVTKGEVKVDGEDIKKLDLEWVHNNIGFVPQDPGLFSGTIEDNITYGVDKYTQEDLDQAAKLAHAYSFIHDKALFPDGYKTIVGERGIKLSGGQKQRIAIARALIKKPKVFIFDEATSSLDAESEYQVQEAIDSIIKECSSTVIIIAHRLSTVKNCKRILVMQGGKVVEEGNHQTLLSRGGVYKALVERQLSGLTG
eukprot:TRINITY_DN1560_c0_g1_i3.p1 TRINITY_DN1560_c0_g1~~TRINITY_DN1560_c0_g1_i3.p1  ORF type:complete len:300 (-),score=62.41 TRINITY_DN1560_c0_g1_i3:69-968(-)